MKFNSKVCLLGMLTLAISICSQAYATPLEALHSNNRWLERPGTITITVYSDWDHQKIETTTCDGKLNSAYTLAGELHENDNAYFVMETLTQCATVSFKPFGPFERHLMSTYTENLYGSIDADLTQILASKDGMYSDDFLAHNSYAATSTSFIENERVIDGTLIANYKIERVGDQINFSYDSFLPDGHLEKHVSGLFRAIN